MTKRTPLEQAIYDADTLIREKAKIDKIESEAQALMNRILEDGEISGQKEQADFTSASFRLQLCPANRKKVLAAIQGLESEIPKLVTQARREFNEKVRAARAAKVAEIVAALAPFYPGDEKKRRKDAEALYPPAIRAFEKFSASEELNPNATFADRIASALRLVGHIARVSKLLGFRE